MAARERCVERMPGERLRTTSKRSANPLRTMEKQMESKESGMETGFICMALQGDCFPDKLNPKLENLLRNAPYKSRACRKVAGTSFWLPQPEEMTGLSSGSGLYEL